MSCLTFFWAANHKGSTRGFGSGQSSLPSPHQCIMAVLHRLSTDPERDDYFFFGASKRLPLALPVALHTNPTTLHQVQRRFAWEPCPPRRGNDHCSVTFRDPSLLRVKGAPMV